MSFSRKVRGVEFDKACICFNNHGTIIEFKVWYLNKTNIFLLELIIHILKYTTEKKADEKRYSGTYISNQYRMSNCCLCKITEIFLINF